MHRDSYFETLRPVWTPANGDSTSTLEDTSAGIEDKGLNSLPSNITRDRTPSLLYYKEFNALPSNIGGWHVRPQAVRSLRSPIEKTTSHFELLYQGGGGSAMARSLAGGASLQELAKAPHTYSCTGRGGQPSFPVLRGSQFF